eukprot:3906838-Rhodomonas_salina.1
MAADCRSSWERCSSLERGAARRCARAQGALQRAVRGGGARGGAGVRPLAVLGVRGAADVDVRQPEVGVPDGG